MPLVDVVDDRGLVKETIAGAKRWVVKIGSSLLTNAGQGLYLEGVAGWVAQIAELKRQGVEVVLVSSGAVAEGMIRLKRSQRPESIHELQACAAIGQMGLVQAYESEFKRYGIVTAQVLLTHDVLKDRVRYSNVRRMLRSLIQMGVVPIINENDSVATEELQMGDNDTLAAVVVSLWDADFMVILTDTDGLYSLDPALHADAQLVRQAWVRDEALDAMVSSVSQSGLGRGGMKTKLKAARMASNSGASTYIASGMRPSVLLALSDSGTLLYAEKMTKS